MGTIPVVPALRGLVTAAGGLVTPGWVLPLALLLLFGLILFVLLVILWPRRDRSRARRVGPGSPRSHTEPQLSAGDLADLERAFAEAGADQQARSTASVLKTLEPMIRRRVPLRAIRRAPVSGVTRLIFADGTAVLVRSRGGALGQLALVAAGHSVCLVASTVRDGIAILVFEDGDRQVMAEVVGTDQAD